MTRSERSEHLNKILELKDRVAKPDPADRRPLTLTVSQIRVDENMRLVDPLTNHPLWKGRL